MTLPAGWNGALAARDFTGGLVSWTGPHGVENVSVISVSGDKLTLSASTRGMTTATDVAVSLGCNRTLAHCEMLHNNVQNFGGQPYIPLENPLKTNPFT
jgi:hypothetical protein